MRERLALLLLATLALAAARCGPEAGPSGEPGVAVRVEVHDAVGNETRAFASGAPIHLRVEIENQGATPASLGFSSGRTHDVVILGAGGAPVWRWSDGRSFTQALTEIGLEPDEALRFGLVCEPGAEGRPALPPGRYEAVAVIPRLGAEIRSPAVPLEIR